MTETIIVSGGVLGQRHHGGHLWAFAQYVRGFRQMGHRVVFVDQVEHEDQLGHDDRQLRAAVELLGGTDTLCVLDRSGGSVLGLARSDLVRLARRSTMLLNVMGYLDDREVFEAPRMRIFLDIDPGFPQMWHELGLTDMLEGHDAYVTVASCMGADFSKVPTCGREWISTYPPVVLEDWPAMPPRPGEPFTSIATWRGPFGPVDYDGTTYGLRVHEFRRFLDLPTKTSSAFEIVLDIDEGDHQDLETLLGHGWSRRSPSLTADPLSYRSYVGSSKAELQIAKNMYVATSAGWFSDRSACYLATGRPVMAEETGFSKVLPTGDGLLSFSDVDEAAAAVADVTERYDDHCHAARALAEDCFDSQKVLGTLLRQLDAV